MPPPASVARSVVTLAAIVAAGTLLRLLPWFIDPGLDLTSDAAYHERIVAATVQTGSVLQISAFAETQ